MKLGRVLKLLRTSANLTQGQMAEQLGISQNYLSLIEQNKRTPGKESIKAFATSLKISEDALKFVATEIPAELSENDSLDFQKLQKNILALLIYQSSGELKEIA